MISASEALKLPNAQLTETEQQSVMTLLAKIETHVHASMQYAGIDITIRTTNRNVINAVDRVLKSPGMNWATSWTEVHEESKIRGAPTKHIGYRLLLLPTFEGYEETAKTVAH